MSSPCTTISLCPSTLWECVTHSGWRSVCGEGRRRKRSLAATYAASCVCSTVSNTTIELQQISHFFLSLFALVGLEKISTMQEHHTSPQQALPTELMNLVLRQIDDNPFVWVDCRQLSRKLRTEVDFLFRSRQLKNCTIYWPLSGMIATSPLLARLDFSHTSSSGAIAYFKTRIAANPRSGETPDVRAFEAQVAAYAKTKNTLETDERGQYRRGCMPVTRIGAGPNNTYMTDMALPNPRRDGARLV